MTHEWPSFDALVDFLLVFFQQLLDQQLITDPLHTLQQCDSILHQTKYYSDTLTRNRRIVMKLQRRETRFQSAPQDEAGIQLNHAPAPQTPNVARIVSL